MIAVIYFIMMVISGIVFRKRIAKWYDEGVGDYYVFGIIIITMAIAGWIQYLVDGRLYPWAGH